MNTDLHALCLKPSRKFAFTVTANRAGFNCSGECEYRISSLPAGWQKMINLRQVCIYGNGERAHVVCSLVPHATHTLELLILAYQAASFAHSGVALLFGTYGSTSFDIEVDA